LRDMDEQPECFRFQNGLSGTALTDHYADILRKLREAGGLLADIFAQATPRFNNPVNLKRILAMIDEEDWSAMDVDVKGAAFEGLLEKAASEGKKGAGQKFARRKNLFPGK
jgi:type I restriction enzyme M protein